jgi:RAC serine/threonine-protein kinase
MVRTQAGSVITVHVDKPPKKKGKESQKYGFMIRFMQMTRFVERSFHLDTMEERTEWLEAR